VNSRLDKASTNDLQFCWQQVLRVRPEFRLSHAYAPEKYSAGLLALHAWFSAVEESVCRVSDETVAQAKLLWWQQQLFGSEYGNSPHPITRQLRRCEVIPSEAREHAHKLLETTRGRLDAPALPDEASLKSLCRNVGVHAMRLELAVQRENRLHGPLLETACAVNGLVQLLRESSRSLLPSYTWVPLNLLARHDVTRAELQNRAHSEATRLLMAQICAEGLAWIGEDDFGADPNLDPAWQLRHRHWIIQTRLNVRRLKKLRRSTLQMHSREFSSMLLGDAWLAWRTARAISKGRPNK